MSGGHALGGLAVAAALWVAVARAQGPGPEQLPAPDPGAEARLRLDQDRYRSRLSREDLERAQSLQERYHQEWLESRPQLRPGWTDRPAPPVAEPGPPVAPPAPMLPQRFEQEAWDLQRLQQRQQADVLRLRQREQAIGLPPGASLRQLQQFQMEDAQQQLNFDMLRPTR
ncbi:MAG: hypothetical protein KA217_03885 [Gammaproteobacteria bacterium]|nr:hypothetical protein [Gammaproteobacteria bacterium]